MSTVPPDSNTPGPYGYPAEPASPYGPGAGQPAGPGAPYQQQPYGYAPTPAPYGQPPAPGTDGVSIAALVTGILFMAIVPLVLGIVGLNRVKKSGRSGKGMAIAGIVLGALETIGWGIFIALFVVVFSNEDVRDAIDDAVDAANGMPTLTVGQCFDLPGDATDLFDLEDRDCSGPHTAEVVGTQDLTDADYPGEDSAVATSEDFCRSVFADYVGIDFDSSALDMGYAYPTEASWALGDRQIACYAMTMDGSPLAGGSVQGTAQ